MRRLPLLFTMLALAAPLRADDGDVVKDARSGLVVKMPAQWSRDSGREKGSVRFAAIYDLNRTKYVLFSVETGSPTGFVEKDWLDREKGGTGKYLKSVDIPWSTESATVGGVRATRFTVGGKTEKDVPLRVRGCGFVKNDVFFRITEVSYNGANEEAADAVQAIWDAVSFEEPNPFADEGAKEEGSGAKEDGSGEEKEEGSGEEGTGGEEAPKGEPTVVEDKTGNFKVTAPPGWIVARAPTEDDADIRMVLQRTRDNGDVLAHMEIFRLRWDDSSVFSTMEPGDFLIELAEKHKFFEAFFEEGSAKLIRPEIDVRTRLGDYDKSCAYELRGLLPSQETKRAEAQKLKDRGDKTVVVPEFKPTVVRGRLAMISPYIYVVRAYFVPSIADNEQLVTEYNALLDSWAFESTEGTPPPLAAGIGQGGLQALGNTLADPANKDERKGTKVQEYKKGTKVEAALKVDYVLPPGFQLADVVKDEATSGGGAVGGQDVVLQVVAQDGNNGWVWISMIAVSQKSLSSTEKFKDKQTSFDTWISNFSSLARNTGKMPKKPGKVNFGNLRGDGCELSGKINDFRASEINLVTIEGGWWIQIEVKTRGKGRDTFEDGLKTFMRKFRASKK